jgi:hypothetical protein
MTILELPTLDCAANRFEAHLFVEISWEQDPNEKAWEPYLEWKNRNAEKVTFQKTVTSDTTNPKTGLLTVKKTTDAFMTFSAQTDLTGFPFDTQALDIVIGSDHVEKTGFVAGRKNPATIKPHGLNPQWQLRSLKEDDLSSTNLWGMWRSSKGRAQAHAGEQEPLIVNFLPTDPQASQSSFSYAQVRVSIVLHRKPWYFLLNVAFLAWLHGTSALGQFGIPWEEQISERLSLDFTLLLSVVALKIAASSMLPLAPDTITALDQFIIFTLLMIFAASIQSMSFRLLMHYLDASHEWLHAYDWFCFPFFAGCWLAVNMYITSVFARTVGGGC